METEEGTSHTVRSAGLRKLYKPVPVRILISPWHILHSFFVNGRLLRDFGRRMVVAQYRGSQIGVLWNLLQPLLLFSVYAFVFGLVFDSRFGGHPDETRFDYTLGLFLSLALAQLVLDALVLAPNVVIQVPNFVKKVVFPLEILPVAALVPVWVRSLMSQGLVLVFCLVFGRGGGLTWFYLPLIFLALVTLGIGLSWWLSGLGVFFRDVGPTMQFVSAVLMFTSGLFYSASQIPTGFDFLQWNPLLLAVSAARDAVVWHVAPTPLSLVLVWSTALIVFVSGHLFFQTMKPAFADVL